MFQGNQYSGRVVTRTLIKEITGKVRLYPFYNHETGMENPLGRTEVLLDYLSRNCTAAPVPTGLLVRTETPLGANAARPPGDTWRTRLQNLAFRFTSFHRESPLTSTMWQTTAAVKGVGYLLCGLGPTGLWAFLMAGAGQGPHARVQKYRVSAIGTSMGPAGNLLGDPRRGRLDVTQSVYTRHAIEHALWALTDGEVRLLGSVRFNNLLGINHFIVKRAVDLVKDSERGTWLVCHCFEKELTQQLTSCRSSRKNVGRDM